MRDPASWLPLAAETEFTQPIPRLLCLFCRRGRHCPSERALRPPVSRILHFGGRNEECRIIGKKFCDLHSVSWGSSDGRRQSAAFPVKFLRAPRPALFGGYFVPFVGNYSSHRLQGISTPLWSPFSVIGDICAKTRHFQRGKAPLSPSAKDHVFTLETLGMLSSLFHGLSLML